MNSADAVPHPICHRPQRLRGVSGSELCRRLLRRTTSSRSTMRVLCWRSPRPSDAVLFISHLLPRREAVWWAAQCVRALLGEGAADEALRAAEIWVRTPEDDNRRAALSAANDSDRRKPTTWLAFAAGWSGGSLLPADQKPVPPPAGACAMAANTAIMMAVAAGDPRAVVDRIEACAEAGVRFASGGEPTVFVREAAPQ